MDQNQRPATRHDWRDHNGPEVDWVVKNGDNLLPIEVKWTKKPTPKDTRHLTLLIKEYPTKQGLVVCQIDLPFRLTETIIAIPYHMLPRYLTDFITKG